MPTFEINYVAVLIAAAVYYVVGAFWYSPLLLGNVWIKEMGFKKEDMEKMKDGIWKSYLGSFLSAFISSFVLAHFVDIAGAKDFASGSQTGFWIWLGFIVTLSSGMMWWEGKSLKLYLIYISYNLIGMLLMGGILAVM